MQDVSGMPDEMPIDPVDSNALQREATEPVAEPMTEPVAEPVAEPMTEPATEPHQPTIGAITQFNVQPAAITAMQVLTINYRQEEFGTLEKMAALR
jgi:hypothetical protein